MWREKDLILERTTNALLKVEESREVVGEEFLEFHFDKHVVVVGVRSERDEVIAGQLGELHQNLLDLNWEDVDTTEDNHIVGTSTHAVDTDVVAAAGTGASQDTGKVACTVPDQRHGFATDRCENEFSNLAIGNRLQRLGIHNLDDIVVLPEVQAILLLAFEADTGSTHLRHTERVVGLHAQHVLDTLALFLRMRLSSDGKHLELGIFPWIDALLLHNFVKTCHITWHRMKCCGSEIADELDLTKRIACCRRNGQHSQALGSILEAQSTREHTISRRILEDVVWTQAHHPKVTGYLVCPLVQVVLRVEDYGRITSRAAR